MSESVRPTPYALAVSRAVGDAIRTERRRLKRTQDEVARACGHHTKGWLSRIERGERDVRLADLCTLAVHLHTSAAALLVPAMRRAEDALR